MIKFTNGLVLDKDFNITKQDVFVDGDSIVAIGDCDKTADTVYDLNGNLLNFVLVELVEHDNIVNTVQEFRTEYLAEFACYKLLDVLFLALFGILIFGIKTE